MKKNIALVLSSGGARGLAHIGVIEQLIDSGYNITSISGTSIGSLIGGLYATGHLNDYKEWVSSLSKSDVLTLMDFQLKPQGFIKGNKVFNKMKPWLNPYNFEDLKIPLSVVATDILNRKEVVFKKGNLLKAIRASIAVPGFIAPLKHHNNWLFDGGVVNPIPLSRVTRTKDDLLVAVDLNAFVPNNDILEKKTADTKILQSTRLNEIVTWVNQNLRNNEDTKKSDISYVRLMTQMFDMMQEQISKFSLDEHHPDILINIPRDSCSTFEFHRSNEMLMLGRQMAKKALLQYNKKSEQLLSNLP
ncbi:MAG: patatin-like phospholipase family protein [Bacteroidales bacterium]|nr:patatin-like phospholipase family protein [Bacteroidales bacterium]